MHIFFNLSSKTFKKFNRVKHSSNGFAFPDKFSIFNLYPISRSDIKLKSFAEKICRKQTQ